MRLLLNLPLLLIAVCLSACDGPTYSYGYRATIEVETKSGLRSGSSTYRYSIHSPSRLWASMATLQSKLQGEATVVDLGGGRALVMTMRNWGMTDPNGHRELGSDFWHPTSIFLAREGLTGDFQDERNRGLEKFTRQLPKLDVPLTLDQGPVLLAYTPEKNGRFVIVESDDLTSLLGPDVHLRGITVSPTYDRPTRDEFERRMSGVVGVPGYITAWSPRLGLLRTFDDSDFVRR